MLRRAGVIALLPGQQRSASLHIGDSRFGHGGDGVGVGFVLAPGVESGADLQHSRLTMGQS
jgi:hypothetical protein